MKEIHNNKNITIIGCLLRAKDKNDAITQMGQILFENGFIKECFIPATLEREEKYPTGLPTSGLQIALPHTDGIYVNKSAIVIGVLENPVTFNEMGNPLNHLQVKIICLLAIREPNEQIQTLQMLSTIFEKSDILEQISLAKNANEIENLFINTLENDYA